MRIRGDSGTKVLSSESDLVSMLSLFLSLPLSKKKKKKVTLEEKYNFLASIEHGDTGVGSSGLR